jgi:hypothetical protein
MTEARRSMILKVLAVLFAVRGLTNTFKFLSDGGGMVFFGKKLDGMPDLILSQLFGILLYAYAYGMWERRSFALPLGYAYFAFVVVNVFLFPIVEGLGAVGAGAYGAFALFAIGSNVLALWLLRQAEKVRRETGAT